jgi:hypothetical protein
VRWTKIASSITQVSDRTDTTCPTSSEVLILWLTTQIDLSVIETEKFVVIAFNESHSAARDQPWPLMASCDHTATVSVPLHLPHPSLQAHKGSQEGKSKFSRLQISRNARMEIYSNTS